MQGERGQRSVRDCSRECGGSARPGLRQRREQSAGRLRPEHGEQEDHRQREKVGSCRA